MNPMVKAEIHSHPEELEIEKEAVAFFEAVERAGASGAKEVPSWLGTISMVVAIPPLGEGDNSLVYPIKSVSLDLPVKPENLCVKVSKQLSMCRNGLIQEEATTRFFTEENIAVPRIHYMDSRGRFAIKDFIEGETVTSVYMRFDTFPARIQSLILEGLEKFLSQLLDLFERRPECKVSISPNNIYLLTEGERLRMPLQFVLIDPGPSPNKSYDGFNFDKYWNELLPNRISKYKRTGYLQWLIPREVSQAEYEEAREFEIFRDLENDEVDSLLDIATTLEFDPCEVILKEGTIGENFYLLLDGEVMLQKGHYVKPGAWNIRLRSGSVLGEMGFLMRVPRSMTAVAVNHCKVVEITNERFQTLLDKKLIAPYKLLRNIAVILAERLHKLDHSHQKLLERLEKEGD
jgi:CRP/FNR family transcriptional regulator, cyclic AMP receptor protein